MMHQKRVTGLVQRHTGNIRSPGYRPIPPDAVKPVKPRRRERVRRARIKLG